MQALLRHWVALIGDRRGVTALEYAIIAGLVGAVIAVAFGTLGTNINSIITNVSGKL